MQQWTKWINWKKDSERSPSSGPFLTACPLRLKKPKLHMGKINMFHSRKLFDDFSLVATEKRQKKRNAYKKGKTREKAEKKEKTKKKEKGMEKRTNHIFFSKKQTNRKHKGRRNRKTKGGRRGRKKIKHIKQIKKKQEKHKTSNKQWKTKNNEKYMQNMNSAKCSHITNCIGFTRGGCRFSSIFS